MSKLPQLFKPWTWFSSKSRLETDRHNARRAIAGMPRKRKAEEDLVAAGRKKLKPTEKSAPKLVPIPATPEPGSRPKQRSPPVPYWSNFGFYMWLNNSGQLNRESGSSITHATSVADFKAQVQLHKEAAANPAPHGTVVVQSTASPHTNGRRAPDSARPLTSMPPPSRPLKQTPVSRREQRQSLAGEDGEGDIEDRTTASVAPSTTSRRRLPQPDGFDLEQARRHAAAVTLPQDSGVWALSEKQLFYHLALRGFEPLIPEHWMVDFKTLPLSLFANENTDPPLIEVLQGSEFRAQRALRDLIETGKIVRDKSLASPSMPMAKTVEKSIKGYFAWAFADGGFDTAHADYVPNYLIMTRRRGQTTAAAIAGLNTRLRKLAFRHRERLGILSSIEPSAGSSLHNDLRDSTTQVFDDSAVTELPVLVGVLIVSTILVVFTLNGYNSLGGNAKDEHDIDNSGLRFIAKFDFGNSAYDVWNAIAVAITAVHIREGMENNGFDKMAVVKVESGVNDDEDDNDGDEDVDLSPGRMIKTREAGKKAVNGEWFNRNEGNEGSTLVIDDDPDR